MNPLIESHKYLDLFDGQVKSFLHPRGHKQRAKLEGELSSRQTKNRIFLIFSQLLGSYYPRKHSRIL
jgi:hypothetical protein